MRSRSCLGVGVACVVLAVPCVEARLLTVTASRGEALYAQTETPDCSALSKLADTELPYYVVRLRAVAPAGSTPDRFQWQVPVPDIGVLAADEDIGPDVETPVIHSLCAELGNGCVLTAEQLAVYSKPTILWVAPTCNVLPDKTATPFKGGQVKIGVQAFSGKRRVGKGGTSIGYGRKSFVTLFVSNGGNDPYRDGRGKPFEPTVLDPLFAARVSGDLAGIPPITQFEFDSGGGGVETVSPGGCSDFDACASGFLYPPAAGAHVPVVKVHLSDNSALCDKLAVRVTATPKMFSVDVTTNPKRLVFTPGESVGVQVLVRNTSPRGGNRNILFQGADALTCDSEVKIGKTTLTKTTHIDLQHCSTTITRPCESNVDCAPSTCDTCEANETCLTSSHCENSTLGCVRDRDCGFIGSCVIVIPARSIILGAGDASKFVDSMVPIDNTLPSEAAVTETWVVNSYNAGSESKVLKYRIRPKP